MRIARFPKDAWRTTNSPAVRHDLGIWRWCSRRTCLRSQKNNARRLGPDKMEGGRGPPFSTAGAESRKKAVLRPIIFPVRPRVRFF